MNIWVNQRIQEKLQKKHCVTVSEVRQCFLNRELGFLEDTRDEHKSDPPKMWFISETNQCRKLKVVFVVREFLDQSRIDICTAYPPNNNEIAIYQKFAK